MRFRVWFVVAVLLVASVSTSAAGEVVRQNGDVVAFTRSLAAPKPLVVGLVEIDGRGLRSVRTGITPSSEPEWSPDGRWLLFRGGPTDDLYLVQPDGTHRRQLTRDRAHEQAGAWSRDGTKIAFQRWGPSGLPSIWVLQVRTQVASRLTRDALGAGQPSWSPDGRRIAFTSAAPRNAFEPELWAMNTDGSGQHRLFPRITGASHPVWSPDGRALLITDGDELYVLNAQTGRVRHKIELRASSAGEKTDPFPEWSPDGEMIVFDELDAQGRPGVWIVNADGTGRRRVIGASRAVSGASHPTWQPKQR